MSFSLFYFDLDHTTFRMKITHQLLPLAAFALAELQEPLAQLPSDSVKPLTLDAIPLLGFGTWNLNRDNATEAVSWAIQTGYRHIDCAAAYGNEELVGLGIKDGLEKTGLVREDIWVTSKLWNDHHDPNRVEEGLDTTLHKLGVGYLDLYHMHWPVASTTFGGNKIDYVDTWGAMVLQLEKGKTRHIGVSNFDPYQLKTLLNSTSHPPSVHQMVRPQPGHTSHGKLRELMIRRNYTLIFSRTTGYPSTKSTTST